MSYKKIIEFSSSLKLNEIHIVNTLSARISKNEFFSRKALISGDRWLKNLGKSAITETSIVMEIGDGQFRKRISAPTPWYQNPRDVSIFLHARPNFREKNEKTQFSGQNLTFL